MDEWLNWPEPSDPPEDEDPLATVAAAIGLVAQKLRSDPELTKGDALLFIKTTLPEVSLFFRTIVWPEARRLAGLPAQPRGRPRKKAVFISPSHFLE